MKKMTIGHRWIRRKLAMDEQPSNGGGGLHGPSATRLAQYRVFSVTVICGSDLTPAVTVLCGKICNALAVAQGWGTWRTGLGLGLYEFLIHRLQAPTS